MTSTPMARLNKDDFNETLMNQITVDGQTMAVPFDNHGWLLWYNTKLIKDAGLDPENLPKNGDRVHRMGAEADHRCQRQAPDR